MARGAAALGANGRRGFDVVYPFLYGTSDLDVNNVGSIIVRVKNRGNDMAPNADVFKEMGSLCLQAAQRRTRYTIYHSNSSDRVCARRREDICATADICITERRRGDSRRERTSPVARNRTT